MSEYDPNCPACEGTGQRDSGGFHPWGESISLPCDCDEIRPKGEPIGGSSNLTPREIHEAMADIAKVVIPSVRSRVFQDVYARQDDC